MADTNTLLQNIENRLSALLALTVLSLDTEKAKGQKIEALLKKVGLEVADIARILGKNEGAVRKAIQRSK